MLITKSFLSDYITNKRLVCHKENPTDCETGPIMCTFMNKCNNNGNCDTDTGKCTCFEGFKGADCSEQVEVLTNDYRSSIKINGTQWVYYQFNENLQPGEEFVLTLSSTAALDIFISAGPNGDPNEFINDLEFKKQSFIKISSSTFPSLTKFVAAVRVNGIKLNGN